MTRVAGRVHALVRFRASLAPNPLPPARVTTFNPRPAFRDHLLPKSGRARWQPALSYDSFRYSLPPHNQKKESYSATGI
jgi:hypothetical protein